MNHENLKAELVRRMSGQIRTFRKVEQSHYSPTAKPGWGPDQILGHREI